MKINNKKYFYFGIIVFAIIIISYFIKIQVESGDNYLTNASLLSIIIFYNPFLLGLYILAGIYLVVKGVLKQK